MRAAGVVCGVGSGQLKPGWGRTPADQGLGRVFCPRGGAELEDPGTWEPFVCPSLGIISPLSNNDSQSQPMRQATSWDLEGLGHKGH